MKKRIFPRIMWFLLLICGVFVLLVAVQFTQRGNFSERIGDMLIQGRYALPDEMTETGAKYGRQRLLDGGITVFFGGLEFQLANAEYITIFENEAVFTQSNGTELFFTPHNAAAGEDNTPELRIWGRFPDNVSAVSIPFKTQRSSVIRGNGNETLTISYNGNRYQFSRSSQDHEAGRLVLLSTAPAIVYRVVTDKVEFSPSDFFVQQAENVQAFADTISLWTDRNYRLWGQMSSQTDEDTIIAWCGEAVQQGNYRSAVATIPVSFSTSPLRSWESAVYQFDRRIGVWERAVRSVVNLEREQTTAFSRLLAANDSGIFAEPHLIEFLAIRGYDRIINEFISAAENMDPTAITLAISPGILEAYADMGRWRPRVVNPFEPLAERVFQLIAENIHRAGDGVFVFSDNRIDTEYNLRLGMALQEWGEKSANSDWATLGRSLVFSVISLGNDNGSIPVSLAIDESMEVVAVSDTRISSARIYRLLGDNQYLPHATATGMSDIWAWTAASSVSVTENDRQMDIAVSFPAGETHYVMLRNIRPFSLLQIHDMNWRRAADFESYYDSSGWYYFESERILVLKIRHRSNVENIRILFTTPTPAVTSQAVMEEQQE